MFFLFIIVILMDWGIVRSILMEIEVKNVFIVVIFYKNKRGLFGNMLF